MMVERERKRERERERVRERERERERERGQMELRKWKEGGRRTLDKRERRPIVKYAK